MAARTIALFAGCLLGLTGCSSESGPGGTGDQTSRFESLSGDELCQMLPQKTVEEHFDNVAFFRVEGQEGGTRQFRDVTCHYGGDSISLDTYVTRPVARHDADAHLDGIFTDTDDQVIEYERVDGLGVAAGFGETTPTGLAGNTLALILKVGQVHYVVKLSTRPDSQLEQLKPLAEVLVPRLQAVLR